MNEELEKVDAPESGPIRPEGKAREKPERKRLELKHSLAAKIAAFVLLGAFIFLLAFAVLEGAILYTSSWQFDDENEFLQRVLVDSNEDDQMSQADRLYARGLLTALYDMSSWWLVMGLLGLAGILACVLFLISAAGHRRGQEGVQLNALDRIPLDLYAVICVTVTVLGVFLFAWLLGPGNFTPVLFTPEFTSFVVFIAVMCLLGFYICFAPFLSLATRVKMGGGIWWRNTVIYRVLKLCWRVVKWCWRLVKRFCSWARYMIRKIPIVPRTALITITAIIFEAFFCALSFSFGYTDGFAVFMMLVYNAALFVAICFGAWQMKSLKAAGERMAQGEIDEKIDTKQMYWEFKKHAENLNSIGDGMAAAVEQRMKSERLKTELITNVSHDIKTPLTSIVNYVDLLQKPHTPEQEAEYLEVLDRQSKRLKKLTEDLVEASKASTGNMNVNIERTNTREIIEQSLAEYGRRMEQGELTVIVNIPEDPPRAMADGRLLWRVLDNLFNNVCKYALAGTRVYIDSVIDSGEAVISVKNISRDPLNISADELMERFVRGDSSRHTEGSGLGLNIAQSLVGLMHGKFSIGVDGDLFKAEIRLPAAR